MFDLDLRFTGLINECKRVTSEYERDLLERAYTLIFKDSAKPEIRSIDAEQRSRRFAGLLELGGHDTCVRMLIPEGWTAPLVMQDRHNKRWYWSLKRWQYEVKHRAETEVLTILACALEAHAICLQKNFANSSSLISTLTGQD